MTDIFKTTLNLPKTAFPMRANLAKREPVRLARWESSKLYERIQSGKQDGKKFILHDGPPYANGELHMGTALNKILKDIVLRYKSMRGFQTPYVPGWDCHGQPIEQHILKQVGTRIHEMAPEEIRKLCHDYAEKYIEIQRKQFKRLGILGDWDRPYTTFDPHFEAGELRCFRELVAAGLVRKGFKVVHWDPIFRTALAEAEIEHHTHTSDSIYVRFPLLESLRFPSVRNFENVSLVIWTTTPWTLPANQGVCLHPDLDYVAVQHEGQTSIVAKGTVEHFMAECDLGDARVSQSFRPGEFDRALCRHPMLTDETSMVMMADHVTLEQGTGCVHTAPGHGADDFAIGVAYGLTIRVPVDAEGRFTDEFPEMRGEFVFDTNPKIITSLKERGLLLKAGKITHDYPFSWRTKEPVIFRATSQWFMELSEGDVRERALNAIDNCVQWIPGWGYDRIRSMVENRPDWCLSRQRSWGVPIPSIRSKATGDSILDLRVIDAFIAAVERHGTDCWFREPLDQFLPEGFTYEKSGEDSVDDFSKEFDILDVWFDSGSSHVACLEQDERLHSPADLYLEGSDQHRGWFQSALLTSIGTRDRAPFRAVLTHGFILDHNGRAMSKSGGNSISPLDIVERNGADVLRLWVASVDYRNDVRLSDEIMSHVVETYRTIRNTLRFQLGNLSDFNAGRDTVALEDMNPIDRWILHETGQFLKSVTAAYENYEFQRAYQLINRFCAVTLSATYHDILKDRLYTFGRRSRERQSAQTAIYHVFDSLLRVLAPVLVFTADESQSFADHGEEYGAGSVHDLDWPRPNPDWKQPQIAEELGHLLKLRGDVNERLEALRQKKRIGQSLEAEVRIEGSASNESFQVVRKYASFLAELFIVSKVSIQASDSLDGSIAVYAKKAEGQRCPRCWRWLHHLVDLGEAPKVCARCKTAIGNRELRSEK